MVLEPEGILKGIEGEAFQPLEYHLELYLDLIRKDVDNGEIVRGWQNYNRSQFRFKDSAELHLLGVELALAKGDWEEAERLLYQMDYPKKFTDRVTLLANRISDLKGFENKIIADELNISISTVKRFVHNIFQKVGVKNRIEFSVFLSDKYHTHVHD